MTYQNALKKLAVKLHEPARRHTSEADYQLMLNAADEIQQLRVERRKLHASIVTLHDFIEEGP